MKIISSTALLLFALSTVWIQRARAQTKDGQKQEIQQLKNKLQQLDQMMERGQGRRSARWRGTQHAPVAPAPGTDPSEGQKTVHSRSP